MHHFEHGDAYLSASSLSSQAKFLPNGFCFDQALTSSIQFIFILKVYVKYHKICLTENWNNEKYLLLLNAESDMYANRRHSLQKIDV